MKTNNSKGQLTYQLEIDKQQKNGFPIPCDFLTTGKIGVIYPTQALEVTYGDTIENKSSVALQFNPLAVPIMANMFIKQEHYYTPYNDVWQNWDNFISGGEELDFTTPPPTISVQDILRELLYYFPMPLNWKNLHVTSEGSSPILGSFKPGYYLLLQIPPTDVIKDNLLEYSVPFFEKYGMLDIFENMFKPSIDAIDEWFENHRNNINNWRDSLPSNVTQGAVNTEYLWLNAPNLIGNLGAGEYIIVGSSLDAEINIAGSSSGAVRLFERGYIDEDYEQFKPSFMQFVNNLNGESGYYDIFRFNDFGKQYFRNYYKLFKPFVGVGSYLDCLNITRLTEVDFYYLFYCGYAKAQIESGEVELYVNMASDMRHSALVLRAQYLIWYNNYRDQLLETKAYKPNRDDELSSVERLILTIPRVRCWEKDSYTTALDNPATADAVVPTYGAHHDNVYRKQFGNVSGVGIDELRRNDGLIYETKFADGETLRIPTGLISGMHTHTNDTNTYTKYYMSLHMLDAVKRAQKFLRKALFFGNRIQDFIYTTWGVKHLDARLRLPELLATSTDMVNIQTLVNNTTTEVSDAGERAGLANGFDNGNYFKRFCEESGVIMSFLTIMPQPTYAYGSDRKYSRLDRFDFPIPDFATLGMDAVYDNELTSVPVKVKVDINSNDLSAYPLVFGYQGRYYDAKFRQSTEHGELLTTQDMYTFGRRWNMYDPETRPKLNYEFVHCFPPLDMFVMEDRTEDYWRADVHHDTTAELILPYHSIYF